MTRIPRRLYALSALSALLQQLPFPWTGPVPLWRRCFCWVCLLPLFYLFSQRKNDGDALSWKQAATLGYVCGVLWYLENCYWIFPTMHTYGGLSEPVAAVIVLLFSLYLGLYLGLFGIFAWWLQRTLPRGLFLTLLPCLWVAVEMARTQITGFPWDLLGYSQVDFAGVARLSTITGVMGLSLLVAGVNALWMVRPRQGIGPALALLIAIAAMLWPAAPRTALPPDAPRAVLLQDNLSVGAEDAHVDTRDALMADFERRSVVAAGAAPAGTLKVILWPEAPADFVDGDPQFRSGVGALAVQEHAPVIANSIAVEAPEFPGMPRRMFNSASFFSSTGEYVGRYNKMHLVPFGEYTPFRQVFFFAGHLLDSVGTFTPGAERTMLSAGGNKFGVFICYESIFGTEIRELSRDGARVLVNLSDDGWYGDSSAPWEHLDMVRMRAIENDRWVLRSTNTGVTAAIDPAGRVTATLPRHVRDTLTAAFAFRSDVTFYARHGDWLGWCAVAIVLTASLFGFRPRRDVH